MSNIVYWKDIAYLFCNGKFKAIANEWGIEGKIIGFENDRHGGGFIIEHTVMSAPGTVSCEDCALIARPISDMSDEEKENYTRLVIDYGMNTYKSNTEHVTYYIPFLYLLSIGVYPFNQDNPKDVIWRYKNE